MGGNDIGIRNSGFLHGFPDTPAGNALWATRVCDQMIIEIDRMLGSYSDSKVFVCSSAVIYKLIDSPTNDKWADTANFEEDMAVYNTALRTEYESRLPTYKPGRVFWFNQYDTWDKSYNTQPLGSQDAGPQVHYNQEGYRQQAMNIASMVPQNANTGVLRHRLTYEYNDIKGI